LGIEDLFDLVFDDRGYPAVDHLDLLGIDINTVYLMPFMGQTHRIDHPDIA
jgi:hypothetical protein